MYIVQGIYFSNKSILYNSLVIRVLSYKLETYLVYKKLYGITRGNFVLQGDK